MKLHTYTPEELAEHARIIAEYKRLQAIREKKNDRKVQADREAPHFGLTPNDEPQRRLL